MELIASARATAVDKGVSLRQRLGRLRRLGLTVAARSRLGAALYCLIVSRQMWRECQAVLSGIAEHRRRDESVDLNLYRLRRNIHRLEKGLIMRPRKPVFGADYIGAAVRSHSEIVATVRHDAALEHEALWAEHVLEAYFDAVAPGADKRIDDARRRFTPSLDRSGSSRHVPSRKCAAVSLPDLATFRSLCESRMSVRWFRDAPVSRETVDACIDCGLQSPSACNRQPYRYVLLDSREAIDRVASIPMGTRGFATQIPMLAVLVGDLAAYEFERDRHAVYVDGALSLAPTLLALECSGLSSCVINWPDIESKERQIAEALGLDVFERVLCLVAIGYADDAADVPHSQKRPVERARQYVT